MTMTMTNAKDTTAEVPAPSHIRRRLWPRIAVAVLIALLVILISGAPVTGG